MPTMKFNLITHTVLLGYFQILCFPKILDAVAENAIMLARKFCISINSYEVENVFPSEERESLSTTYTCTCHAIWFPLLQEHHHWLDMKMIVVLVIQCVLQI